MSVIYLLWVFNISVTYIFLFTSSFIQFNIVTALHTSSKFEQLNLNSSSSPWPHILPPVLSALSILRLISDDYKDLKGLKSAYPKKFSTQIDGPILGMTY